MDDINHKNCINSPEWPNHDKTNDSSITVNHNHDNLVYYGIHVPPDVQMQDDYCQFVYQDKTEALKVVKKYKKARFKAFSFYHEALEFAEHGSDVPNNNILDDSLLNKSGIENLAVVGEKPTLFRGPKSQDLVKLRKAIEAGDLEMVRNTIWDNPRYLISSGDTPSILQEGFRYNALHAATKAKNAEMCELILNTVSNVNFIKLLYGDDAYQDAETRAKILVDLYLNTPDKGLNETPLHFAVKFGAAECVEVLTSYPQCDRNFKNKYGKTPSMIICERCEAPAEVKRRIALLLEDSYYVPVLRTEDNSSPPVIGEPFSPTSPPNLNADPIDSRIEIHAYAGPMEKTTAEKFRKMWKRPPRSLQFGSPINNNNKSIDSIAALPFKDVEKGLERLGKSLANAYQVEWKEYWPFLDCFVDIASEEGLNLLEKYLEFRQESQTTTNPHGKDYSDTAGLSTISDLCRHFKTFNLTDRGVFSNELKAGDEECDVSSQSLSPLLCVEKSCQIFANRVSNDILRLLTADFNNSTTGILENQIKHLELLMASYMDDNRFSKVNFQLVHSRLGQLVSYRLKDVLKMDDDYDFVCKNIVVWLEKCNKSVDCFSSDDEGITHNKDIVIRRNSTSANRQVMCLLEHILGSLSVNPDPVVLDICTEADCLKVWEEAKPCSCVWNTKIFKKSPRNNTYSVVVQHSNVSRKLSYGDGDSIDSGNIISNIANMSSDRYAKEDESSSDDEEYYTPPTSPSFLESSDEEDFFEAHSPPYDVFIEGSYPTKTDYSVFTALQLGDCKLSPEKYPNLYKWYHHVGLYSEEQRQRWISPLKIVVDGPGVTSTPTRSLNGSVKFSTETFTPPRSWLRVTGVNSPKPSVKSIVNSSL